MNENQLNELCLEVTNKCSLKCIHCSSMASPSSTEELDLELIKITLNGFRELGGMILEISGGEPLLYKNIYKVINYAKKKNLEVYLYTTGLKIDNNSLSSLKDDDIKKLINIGVDRFLFSLHGSNSKIHKKITGKQNSFFKTIETIKNIKKMNAYVGIHFVPLKANYKELEELCRIADNIEIDEFAILRFVPQGRGNKNKNLLELNEKEVKWLLKTIKKLKKKYKFIRVGCPIDFSFLSGNQNISKCKIGESALTIRVNGDVNLCPAFKYKEIVGNIKKENLKWIWKNSSILNKIRKTRKKIKDCILCQYFTLCRGRCLAQHFYNYGEISEGRDPWCETAKNVYLNNDK